MGTPKRTFLLLPDSGANQLSFRSTLDPTLVKTKGHPPLYDPSKSSTAKKINGYTYSGNYGGYVENGDVYSETISLGGLTIKNQAIELVVKESGGSNFAPNRSGAIGFNPDPYGLSTSPKGLPIWWQNAKSILKQQLFTVNFNPTSRTGTFDLGFINASAYTGTLDYQPILGASTQWYIEIPGLYGAKYGRSAYKTNMTLDTGSSGSYFGYGMLTIYFNFNFPNVTYVPDARTWSFPCSATIPDFSFYVGPNKVR